MFKKEKQKGITLISLVITIILLLILATVAINLAVDSDGLFRKAGDAANKWNTAIGTEKSEIESLLGKIDELTPEELKPMVTKWNVQAGDEVYIEIYQAEYIYSDDEGNDIVTELPNNTDVTIDWGDGEVEHYTSTDFEDEGYGSVYHTYNETNNDVTVTITGKCNVIGISGDVGLLTEIEAWGNTESYYYNFSNCYNLVSIAAPEKDTFKNVISFENIFMFCSSLTSIPDNLFANCDSVTNFMRCFSYCEALTSIPDNLFANCSSAEDFTGTFENCTSLLNIPEHLFDDCQNVKKFYYTFNYCSALTGEAIPLWERVPNGVEYWEGIPNGYACYVGCDGLSNYETIPVYWRESGE